MSTELLLESCGLDDPCAHPAKHCVCKGGDETPIWPSLTPEQAKAAPTVHGYGLMLDGMTEFWPSVPCMTCGKFVGRDGHIGYEHFEMSNELASVEGECRRCINKEKS